MKEQKLGAIIPVRKNGEYSGQSIEWTEACLDTEVLEREKVFFHSSDYPLKEFRTKRTCMYEGYAVSGHVYAVYVSAGTEVWKYRGGERRVTLAPGMRIEYIGEIKYNFKAEPIYEIWTGWIKEYMEKYGDDNLLPPQWREEK